MLQTRTVEPGTLELLKRLMSLPVLGQFYLVGGYPILFPHLEIGGVRMLDIRDIAPMKLKAIAQRGSKKDFFDIYFLLDQLPLLEMLRLFSEKFKQQEIFHVIKSLTYFEDAENYADPKVFDKTVTWEKVKNKVFKAVQALV